MLRVVEYLSWPGGPDHNEEAVVINRYNEEMLATELSGDYGRCEGCSEVRRSNSYRMRLAAYLCRDCAEDWKAHGAPAYGWTWDTPEYD